MKKRLLAALLIAVMLIPSVLTGTYAAGKITVSYTSPAIAVDAGDTVDLSEYEYAFDSTLTPFTDYTWTSEAVTIENNKITVSEKGVYALKGTKGEEKINVYIVAKNATEDEYVLYENDFSSDISDIKTTSGSASVSDGKLLLSTNTFAMLPEYLGDFGDYKIEAVACMPTATEGTRWFSFIHRIQNNSYPYYQMAIRRNATASNGVEFAERTKSNDWSVTYTASNSEVLSPTKYYTFTICAKGSVVTESIDGTLLIFNKDASLYDRGRVGMQTNGSTMSLDSIKVCLQLETPVKPATISTFVDARAPESNLITTPSLISRIDTSAELDSVLTSSPATAFARVNGDGNVVDKDGAVICDIDTYVKKLDGKVIAGFIPADNKAVDAVVNYMTTSKLDDVSMLIEDISVGEYARKKDVRIRTMILISEDYLKEHTLMDIREAVNASSSKTAVLPYSLATKDNVQYLQKLLVSVWVMSDEEENEASIMKLILTGANGIVVDDRATAETCFTKFFGKDTLTRTIWQIGHRGVPSLAPENTIEGSVLAAENGANIIENDIYLTTDGVIVVMHDGSVDRTTNGTGNIESMTYEILQEFVLDAVGGISGTKIPTLEQYFKEFKDTDTFVFIEIKSGNAKIIDALVALVEKYDIADQISVISFNADQLMRLNAKAPYISTGFLCSGITSTTDDVENVKLALNQTLKYNTTFNQSYSGISADFVAELQNRGCTVWPWTFGGDKALFLSNYLAGANGLTTNNCQFLKATMQFVYSDVYDYTLKSGEKATLDVRLKTYADKVYALPEGNTVMVSGEDVISIEGNEITALKNGTASFFCNYETDVCGRKVTITSQLFTVTVSAGSEPAVSGETSEGTGNQTNGGWLVYAIIGGIVVIAAVVVILIVSKKKKA